MHIDGALERISLRRAVEGIEQRLSREDPAARLHQRAEQAELRRRDWDDVAVAAPLRQAALRALARLALPAAREMLAEFIRQEFTRNGWSKLAAAVAMPVLKRFKQRVDLRTLRRIGERCASAANALSRRIGAKVSGDEAASA